VALVFLAGLGVRIRSLDGTREVGPDATVSFTRWQPAQAQPYLENDESIYLALSEQLERGRGYTLRGHPLLSAPWVDRAQYGQALFFHPPGGVWLFWLFQRVAGEAGPALVEVASFAVFFASVLWLGVQLMAPAEAFALVVLAVSAAFTPIMAHVVSRLWLDGPLLAATTAAWALFVHGHAARRTGVVLAAGVVLGAAAWIKVTVLFAVPGAILTAWSLRPGEGRALVRAAGCWLAVAAVVQAPWEIWQWRVVGSAFPAWAGRPSAALIRMNAYVRYLTVTRSPWIYLELLPQVVWTLVPSLVVVAACWRERAVRGRGLALLGGVAVVVGANIALGAIGYSKLLRYIVLVTPATTVLCGLAAGAALRRVREADAGARRLAATALVGLVLAGLGLEIAQTVKTTLVDTSTDLIVPLTGLRRPS